MDPLNKVAARFGATPPNLITTSGEPPTSAKGNRTPKNPRSQSDLRLNLKKSVSFEAPTFVSVGLTVARLSSPEPSSASPVKHQFSPQVKEQLTDGGTP